MIAENTPTHSRAKAKTLYKTYVERCISFSLSGRYMSCSLLGLLYPQHLYPQQVGEKAGIICVVERPRRNVNTNSEGGDGSGEQTGESCAKPALWIIPAWQPWPSTATTCVIVYKSTCIPGGYCWTNRHKFRSREAACARERAWFHMTGLSCSQSI